MVNCVLVVPQLALLGEGVAANLAAVQLQAEVDLFNVLRENVK